MQVLPRVQLGQPILRTKAARMTRTQIQDSETRELIKQMFYTLSKVGGIGLAAPQIGKSIQLAVVNVAPSNVNHTSKTKPPKKRQRFVMINPKIIDSSKKTRTIHEGCLSFIDMFGEVTRPSSVKVSFRDETGTLQQKTFSGLVATVVQHEIDHLQGKVWIDSVSDTRSLMTRSEYKKWKLLQEVADE